MTSVVVAVVALGIPLALVGRVLVVGDERGEVERSAVTVAATLSIDPPTAADRPELPAAGGSSSIGYYRAGSLLTGAGPGRADEVADAAATGAVSARAATWRPALARGEGVVAAAPVTDGARVVGVVRVATGAGTLWWRTAAVWAALAAASAGSVLLARLLAARTASRMAASLSGLRDAAAAVGDGDLARRPAPTGIAEVDDVADALVATAGRLQELLARERALGAAASHQLRTPVMRLQLALDAARAEGVAGTSQDLLDQAADEAAGLADELESLLRVSKDGARASGGVDELDLSATLDGVERRHAAVVARSGRNLVVGADARLPPALASPSALAHALDVLVDNAVAHGAGTVRVWAREAVGTVAVDVSDDGEGFVRDLVGASLGLALARALVEEHGGRLVLPGARASSRVSVVLRPVGAPEPGTTPAPPSRPGTPRAGSGRPQPSLRNRQPG